MNDVVFARGWLWPWLLSLPVAWALLWLLFDRTRQAARRYGAAPRTRVASPLVRSLRVTLLLGCGLLTWMDPRYGDEQVQVERRGLDLIFCLDTSRSMLAADMEPSRLGRAQRDIRSVLPRLDRGDRAGLLVFAGEARLWVPLTHDLDSFRGLLDEVDSDVVKVGGTDLAAALRKALELSDPDNRKTTVVVLLTDGEDLAGAGRQAAGELKDQGLVVYTVGYGSALGSKITVQEGGKQAFLRDKAGQEVVSRLDPDSLRALAEVTGGEFLRAEAMALPLEELQQKRLRPMQKRSYEAGEQVGKRARYQWVLLPLLLLLLFDIVMSGGRNR
ncbi:MAG: VWA domain-containing protein [Planctomycetes bacterium]|nr:VWA domain-containing protein [Planctomycetota bacterium]MCC7399220.1 VWA domain-containing protein [Planctomycetota bacterium]